ncbi:heteromeric transposase endonuclease subunit TnsA [Bacillus idriensis]|uniref:Heteromeric transposase endonuclease subunit TnsA n=1 Tax=Metabacillus idriensis TaxID=324768 RepID=A0A6I2MH85_9BACI|nr:TnsA endonuclease N-terminal domain-containing protein [Metabacillus idriensis]MRX56492.1 heteromeric transposase endonuclease subunit TnsA [Metabacillus idriensis]
MGKRNYSWTEEKIQRYLKEGRGQGELSNYKPWITVQDFSSKGRAHRIKGWTTNRMHQFFSDHERNCFYLLDWAEDVIDIREQFPLDREITTQIAEEFRINHSHDNITKVPYVMTTDFLVTVRKGNKIIDVARTVKPSKELEKESVICKFEIEREYWRQQNIDWKIVTEKEMDNKIVNNIKWVHSSFFPYEGINDREIYLLSEYLKKHNAPIINLLVQFDEIYNLDKGNSLSILKYLISKKIIQIDLKEKFELTSISSQLVFNNDDKSRRFAT